MLRYRDLPTHTTDVLDLTSLTVDEFAGLVPSYEAAFLGYMAEWTLHGRRRQARRCTTYKNCPLPTPEDRLLFMLVYLKQNPTPPEPSPRKWVKPLRPPHPPVCHDGTEPPIPRPQDAIEQKACDSGKKKRDRLKNLLLVNIRGCFGARMGRLPTIS